MRVVIRMQGVEQVQRRLVGIGESIVEMPEAMKEIGEYLAAFFAGEVFASQGGAINEPWPRLSPRYEAVKARKYPGSPMLVRTGLMQRSFKYLSTSNLARVYNTAGYFKYHQSTEARTKIPRRAMMALDTSRRVAIRDIMQTAINKKIAMLP